jgi:hypothetical protein
MGSRFELVEIAIRMIFISEQVELICKGGSGDSGSVMITSVIPEMEPEAQAII